MVNYKWGVFSMHIEFDVTLQCNFSCLNCNRHSNFNDLSSPFTEGKANKAGMGLYENPGFNEKDEDNDE